MPASPCYKKSEIASFVQVVRDHYFEHTPSKWVNVAAAMTIEKVRHLEGGDLFASDSWIDRKYTANACKNKWYYLVRKEEDEKSHALVADGFAIPDLMHSYWAKEKEEEMLSIFYGTDFPEIPEDVFKEIEAELERKKAIQAQ
ncbi:hypothetical protein BPAE_0066g00330 [Botrytis paeoniae]|uniref:Uncharacterized protein n=1 Tax=Botrytis paeoniae TaxID=278948 RepID=A0A4Z1FWG1_9HELO|nr:hypothetical protein BPAE_0066g00330 [Botrytis paeoniae]